MYTGSVSEGICPRFTHANTDVPLPPQQADGKYVWKGAEIFDTAIDIRYVLGRECYIGAAEVHASGMRRMSLYADGVRRPA